MRDKRIWLIIGCILAAGILITIYTNSLTAEQNLNTALQETGQVLSDSGEELEKEEILSPQTPQAQAAAAAQAPSTRAAQGTGSQARIAAAPADHSAGESAGQDPGEEQAESLAGPSVQSEDGVPASSGPASPLEGVEGRYALAPSEDVEDYRQRLEDLDSQISALRESDQDSNAYSRQKTAEAELRLWEGEMNQIYEALLEELPSEEQEELADSQSQWLKDREAAASQKLAGNSPTSMEGLEYMVSMTSWTRDRAYELAEQYEQASGQVPS